eukprot:jgi/Botrbrau1/18412/Bobra.0072s0005.1
MQSEYCLNVAILGAGVFARDAYVPAIRRVPNKVKLCAIWSRSQETTDILKDDAKSFIPEVKLYHGDDGLTKILEDQTIRAVIVVLPVQVQLQVTLRALHAGKHVLQEKPFAATVKEAQEALRKYNQLACQPVWGLAENYRSEKVFKSAANVVPMLGSIIKLDLVADMPMNMTNKYYNSKWRRDTVGCPGGFLMESSVHFIAAVRLLARAGGLGEAAHASGVAGHFDSNLPAPDSLTGWLEFENGGTCSLSISFASASMRFSVSVTGRLGTMEIKRGGWGSGPGEYTLSYKLVSGTSATEKMGFSGIDDELHAFVSLVSSAEPNAGAAVRDEADMAYQISVTEGAQDLCCMESLLRSSAKMSCVVDIPKLGQKPA